MTGRINNQRIKLEAASPFIWFEGTEGGADPCYWQEDAGFMKLYDVSAAGFTFQIDVDTGHIVALTVDTAKTDGQVPIPTLKGQDISGTWVLSLDAEPNRRVKLTRTGNAATEYYILPIQLPHRTTANKGAKLKSITATYSVNNSVDDADDVQYHILQNVIQADGTIMTGAMLAGDADADYDDDHNTRNERIDDGDAPQYHTLTVTIPGGEQAYMADNAILYLLIEVIDSAGGLVFVHYGAVADYDVAVL